MSALSYFNEDEQSPRLRKALNFVVPEPSLEKLSDQAERRIEAKARDEAKHEVERRVAAHYRTMMDDLAALDFQVERGIIQHNKDSKKTHDQLRINCAKAKAEWEKIKVKNKQPSVDYASLSSREKRAVRVLADYKPPLVPYLEALADDSDAERVALADYEHRRDHKHGHYDEDAIAAAKAHWEKVRRTRRQFKVCKVSVPEISVPALKAKRAELLVEAGKIVEVRSAPLDWATVSRGIRNDVAALAASGTPDISDVLRLIVPFASIDELAQGHVKWPQTSIAPLTHKPLQNGNALVAWLFRDELVARLEQEAKARFNADAALTERERRTKIKAIGDTILQKMREEEAIVTGLEAQGIFGFRGTTHPLAFLELEEIPAAVSADSR